MMLAVTVDYVILNSKTMSGSDMVKFICFAKFHEKSFVQKTN